MENENIYCKIYKESLKNEDEILPIETTKVEELQEKTGLPYLDCERLLEETGGSVDLAYEILDNFMASLSGTVIAREGIEECIRNAGLYEKLAANLSNYNTMRGGVKGFKGFVFEELHATDQTVKGVVTNVVRNNGVSDFNVLLPNGEAVPAQAKIGYGTVKVDWSQYSGQKIVIDKGNAKLIESARSAGMDVVESDISHKEASALASKMQKEARITDKTNANITPKIYSSGKIAKQCHQAGVKSAKGAAAFGAGFSIGGNIIDVIDGEKEIGEATIDVAKDTAVAAGHAYVFGVATTAIGSTAVGSAVAGAAAAAGTTVAGTAIGGSIIGASAAATGAVAAAGTAVASTAVGGTIVAGAAAATGAVAAIPVVGAAIVATAPVIAVGTAIGIGVKLIKKVFK